jgi:hypothetical protein
MKVYVSLKHQKPSQPQQGFATQKKYEICIWIAKINEPEILVKMLIAFSMFV